MCVRQACAPSVAHITTSVLARGGGVFSLDATEIPRGTGSGFVWDGNGHVVTNFHVVRNAQRAKAPSHASALNRPSTNVVSGHAERQHDVG